MSKLIGDSTPKNTDLSSVYFVSLGCPKNLVDSQVMLGLLQKNRYTIATEPDTADVIIVNTCSFIEASKEESIDTILDMAHFKNEGNCKVLVASGCLPQRYSKQLEIEMPEVDLFIGTGQYHRITELLDKSKEALKLGAPLPQRSYVNQPAFIHSETDPRVHTGPSYSAYLKISEGCNRRCAFCIIPKLRGNVRSRTVESLVTEAKRLADAGVRELNLVGQDLTEYGMEWKYKEKLETLLPELCKIDGIEWIRLHYVYPDQFSDELVSIIAREKKIVKYLDMPVQHTSDTVLARMNRRLTKSKLFDLVRKLRVQIPGIVIRSSIIVGFPGETEADFAELCSDLSTLDLDYVGLFRYSREEGTPAAEMTDQVHPATKRKRAKTLGSILAEKSKLRNETKVGETFEVMIEGPSEESDLLWQGRLTTQAAEIDGHVIINDVAPELENLKPGDLVKVEVTEAHTHDLVGRVLELISRSKPSQLGLTSEVASVSITKVAASERTISQAH